MTDLSSTLDDIRAEQSQRWRGGERVPAEEFLSRHPALAADAEAALVVIYGEVLLREEIDGIAPNAAEYISRFPAYAGALALQFDLHGLLKPADVRPEVPGYEIVRELGRGGMGVVYLARERSLGRRVAVKVLLSGEFASPSLRRRFRTEAETASRLQHSNIVTVHAIGESGGRLYLVMEYAAGGSLADRLNGTPLEPQTAASLVAALAGALQAAHDGGVVHRDLKPANILLELQTDQSIVASTQFPAGNLEAAIPKITDFGLAKVDLGEGLTATSQTIGTPSYMAPEQATAARTVGPAADIYALGAILYECLTGRPPFKAATPLATLAQVTGREPAPPRSLNPAVPLDLETVCLKCLAKEPGSRYTSVAAFGADLRRFLNGNPVLARPIGATGRAWRWAKRQPALAATIAALAIIVPGAAVLGTALYLRAEARGRESLLHRRGTTDQMSRRAFALSAAGEDAEALALHRMCAGEYAILADAGVETRQCRFWNFRHQAMSAYERSRLVAIDSTSEARSAVDGLASMSRDEPEATDLRSAWLDARFRWAFVARRCGACDAETAMTELLALATELGDPHEPESRLLVRDIHHSRAALLGNLGRHIEAAAAYRLALQFDNGSRWAELTALHACQRAHGERPAEAIATARSLLANPHLGPWVVYNGACTFAVASMSPAMPPEDRRTLADEAMHTLKRALAAEPMIRGMAIMDKDFTSFQDRADFRALVSR